MQWQIDETTRLGVCNTSDRAREYSYVMVKATAKSDTILNEYPTPEIATRMFGTHLSRERLAMTRKVKAVPAKLILRKVLKTGRVTETTKKGVRVQWDSEHYTTVKARDITKYSKAHAKSIEKRCV